MAQTLPDSHFVAMFPLQEVIFSKDDGEALAAGIVTFYSDVARSVLKPIYEQVQLPDNTYSFVALNNPITLNSIGGFEDNDGNQIIPFLFPYTGTPSDPGTPELYYITVYSSTGVLQFTREAWPPGVGDSTNIPQVFENTDNVLANPQFVEVLFTVDPVTLVHRYTVTGTDTVTEIAPDWVVITSGSGTFDIKQVALAAQTIASDAPYAIDIVSSGLSAISLRQRLSASPRLLWGGLYPYVAGYFDAASVLPFTQIPFSMQYITSSGVTYTIIDNQLTTANNEFTSFAANQTINGAVNSNTPPTGYVDIIFTWTVNTHIQFTSAQLVGVQNASSVINFIQQSTARQIDHLFHYYKPELEYKPLPSYLTGWDFSLNPAQPLGATVAASTVGNGKSRYIWDQTIAFTTVDNVISYSRSTLTGGLSVSNAGAASSMAIIQYIPLNQAFDIINQPMSVQLKMFCGTPSINCTVSLYWTSASSVPVINAGNAYSLVSAVSSNGVPTVGGGGNYGTWTAFENPVLGVNAPFTLNSATPVNVYNFSGFDASATAPTAIAGTGTGYVAIVIGIGNIATANGVTIDYCSLVGGLIATRPAPQTQVQVLQDCQYYYETNYALGVALGSGPVTGAYAQQIVGAAGGSTTALYASSYGYTYSVQKRATPNLVFYSSFSGAINKVYGVTTSAGVTLNAADIAISNWNIVANGQTSFVNGQNSGSAFLSTANALTNSSQAYIVYNFTADARLGVV